MLGVLLASFSSEEACKVEPFYSRGKLNKHCHHKRTPGTLSVSFQELDTTTLSSLVFSLSSLLFEEHCSLIFHFVDEVKYTCSYPVVQEIVLILLTKIRDQ